MPSNQTEIIKSLLKVQNEIKNPANTAVNPFLKNKYAPLSEVLNLIRPLLTKNDIVLIQDTGASGEDKIYVQTKLLHTSGETMLSDKLILKPDKQSAQGIGSAITYGRRYQLSTLLGIASEDDNDGNGKETTKTQGNSKKTNRHVKTVKKPAMKRKPAPAKNTPSDDEINNIVNNEIKKKPTKTAKKDTPETVDMTQGDRVNLTELLGINEELDKYIHMAEDVGATAKEVYNECEELLGKQQLSPKEMKKVKEALGMPVE